MKPLNHAQTQAPALQEPDALLVLQQQTESFISKNSRLIMLALGGILILGGLTLVIQNQRQKSHQKEDLALSSLQKVWTKKPALENAQDKAKPSDETPTYKSNEEWEQALNAQIKTIQESHKNAFAGQVASLYQAQHMNEKKDFAAAEKNYRTFLEHNTNPLLHTFAQFGLATALENQHKNDEALSLFQAIESHPNALSVQQAEAILAQARLKEQAADQEAAIKLYEKIVQNKNFEQIPAKQKAEHRLNWLKK